MEREGKGRDLVNVFSEAPGGLKSLIVLIISSHVTSPFEIVYFFDGGRCNWTNLDLEKGNFKAA